MPHKSDIYLFIYSILSLCHDVDEDVLFLSRVFLFGLTTMCSGVATLTTEST